MTRKEAVKTLHELWRETNDSWYEEAYKMAIEALQREEAEEKGYCHRIRPSNVEVVVRCKDCRWGDVLDSFDSGFCGYSNGLQGYITKDDYCSYGERREP